MTKILAIETSCDETAVAITEGLNILSSVKYTQEIHSQFGGVVPSLAKRGHEERIGAIIDRAMLNAHCTMLNIDAIAVTVGPGLAIALGVGIDTAKKLAKDWGKPIIAVNHIEGHILSTFAQNFQIPIFNFQTNSNFQNSNSKIVFPCLALVISGGHTQIVKVQEIGKYKILTQSLDDDIGEAIDKGARMLGLPYPGGPALEKAAEKGEPKKYNLPLPMARREGSGFSYSGLKSAMWRLVEKLKIENGKLNNEQINDLARAYQDMVFKHLVRTLKLVLNGNPTNDLLVGGGVAANQTLKKLLEEMGLELGFKVWYPPDLVMCTDNAAMIGVAAGFKAARGEFANDEMELDRKPRWRVDEEGVYKSL